MVIVLREEADNKTIRNLMIERDRYYRENFKLFTRDEMRLEFRIQMIN